MNGRIKGPAPLWPFQFAEGEKLSALIHERLEMLP